MNRTLVAALGLVLVLAPASNPVGSKPSSSPRTARSFAPVHRSSLKPSRPTFPAPGAFSAVRAYNHVRALAGGIGPRPAGSSGYRKAVRYVHEAFDELGYRVRLVHFHLPNGSTSRNVVATWPSPARRRILIGAHLDTVPASPGANDNASGVAVILELARILAGTKEARGIRFVAFGAEEVQPGGGHHFGSAAYAETARPRAMVSVDMIGLDRTIIVGWMGLGSRKTVGALVTAAKDAAVGAREEVLPDWSDNGPFERAGVPSALLWTGDEPNHHRPTDVVSNVKKVALLATGTLLIRYVTQQMAL
jgi:putative aminopeptidase FrvX